MPFSEMEPALKRRLSRDERLQISKQALNNKRKKEYQFSEIPNAKGNLFAQADSSLIKGNWKFRGSEELKTQLLFSLQNKPVSVAEFIQYIEVNQVPSKIAPATYMQQLYDGFVEEKVMLAEEEKLLREHPEFKSLLTEYREGILLFDIMEKEVWNKASEDSVGQRKYYEANKTNYQAGDRLEARIFTVADKSVIQEIMTKVNRGDSLNNADLKKFKSIQPFRIYERKDSKVIDRINWTTGLQETELDGQFYLVEVKRLVPPGVKSFEEARAGVISDYQDQLEKQWLVTLKEKFPVKVNNKGKKYVLAELTSN
jgi:peptidyl-prolyl cis-trans isomerase SurA